MNTCVFVFLTSGFYAGSLKRFHFDGLSMYSKRQSNTPPRPYILHTSMADDADVIDSKSADACVVRGRAVDPDACETVMKVETARARSRCLTCPGV